MNPTLLTWTQLLQLLLGAAAVITLLYLITPRRRRVRVPFSPLWAGILTARESSSLWRHLRRAFSWLLALVVAAFLVFAAGDLRPPRQQQGRSLVLLLDTSASMAATDLPGGRLQAAQALALGLVERLGPEDEALVLAVDGQVTPVASFTRDPAVLRGAIGGLQVTATRADWPRAFRFASTALRDRPRGEVLVITDGAFAPGVSLPTDPAFRLLPVLAPAGGDNASILAFNARRYPADRTAYELFVRVKSTFREPIRGNLQLRADGVLMENLPLSLAPGEELIRVFSDLPVVGGRLVARLVFPAGVDDQLPLDDEAYALLPEGHPLEVALVTEGNLFLEAALLLDESVRTTRLTPAEYARLPDPRFDVTLLDRTPPRPDVEGPTVFFAPPAAGSPWPVKGVLEQPEITSLRRDSPLLRWVTLNDVNIRRAQRIATRPGDVVVAASREGPLLVAHEAAGMRSLLFTFDPRESDLPLRAAFPMLLLNAFDWFFRHDAELLSTYPTGETWRIEVPPEVTQVRWITPAGEERTLPSQGGWVALQGRTPGFHTLVLGEGPDAPRRLLAANFTDARESEIRPRDDLRTQAQQEAAQRGQEAADRAGDVAPASRRAPWVLLLLGAGLLLLLEWATYQRRITV